MQANYKDTLIFKEALDFKETLNFQDPLTAFLADKTMSVPLSQVLCQGQSKFVPVWRSKSVPLGLKNIGY